MPCFAPLDSVLLGEVLFECKFWLTQDEIKREEEVEQGSFPHKKKNNKEVTNEPRRRRKSKWEKMLVDIGYKPKEEIELWLNHSK